MTRVLDVYWNADLTGKLVQDAYGVLSFIYDSDFLQRAATGISISLPLREAPHEGDEVRAFFSGLLPEETVRTRLAAVLGVSEKNTFLLLREVGGECAGALALYALYHIMSIVIDIKKLFCQHCAQFFAVKLDI